MKFFQYCFEWKQTLSSKDAHALNISLIQLSEEGSLKDLFSLFSDPSKLKNLFT